MIIRPGANFVNPSVSGLDEDVSARVLTSSSALREYTFRTGRAPASVAWYCPVDVDFRPTVGYGFSAALTNTWAWTVTISYLDADEITVIKTYSYSGSFSIVVDLIDQSNNAFAATYTCGVDSRSFFGTFTRLRVEMAWTPADGAGTTFDYSTNLDYWTAEGA